MSRGQRLSVFAGILVLSGCAAPRPVLYPNSHLQQVGAERAQADIATCVRAARRDVRNHADAGASGRAAHASRMRSLFTWGELSPVERNYTDRCLRGRGYQPIGWK